LPKVVTRRCLEQDLNPRPTDHKSNALPLHHRVTVLDRDPDSPPQSDIAGGPLFSAHVYCGQTVAHLSYC